MTSSINPQNSINHQQGVQNLAPTPPFLTLPPELMSKIGSYLPKRQDLSSLSLVCRATVDPAADAMAYRLQEDHKIWMHKLKYLISLVPEAERGPLTAPLNALPLQGKGIQKFTHLKVTHETLNLRLAQILEKALPTSFECATELVQKILKCSSSDEVLAALFDNIQSRFIHYKFIQDLERLELIALGSEDPFQRSSQLLRVIEAIYQQGYPFSKVPNLLKLALEVTQLIEKPGNKSSCLLGLSQKYRKLTGDNDQILSKELLNESLEDAKKEEDVVVKCYKLLDVITEYRKVGSNLEIVSVGYDFIYVLNTIKQLPSSIQKLELILYTEDHHRLYVGNWNLLEEASEIARNLPDFSDRVIWLRKVRGYFPWDEEMKQLLEKEIVINEVRALSNLPEKPEEHITKLLSGPQTLVWTKKHSRHGVLAGKLMEPIVCEATRLAKAITDPYVKMQNFKEIQKTYEIFNK